MNWRRISRLDDLETVELLRIELELELDDEPTLVGVAPFCDCPFCQENEDDC